MLPKTWFCCRCLIRGLQTTVPTAFLLLPGHSDKIRRVHHAGTSMPLTGSVWPYFRLSRSSRRQQPRG
uniref:Putative secreted protein n=1 Tax=Anopheles marajoara TaxID=58244 RepID=A0A2M4CFK7_9DIPT